MRKQRNAMKREGFFGMKYQHTIAATDFGEVKLGPLFSGALDTLREDLTKSRRTKARRAAEDQLARLEEAAATIAWAAWVCDKVAGATP